ncbi:MAG: helix-turn-helix domain-containing protein [Candidatus Omnitrophica bacterium]|nr:helix-turn-helix domain-containing protein [Candidatus Omnitrophota bacterium]
MPAFNQTLLLWRLHRGFTQEALARHAGIARPNLCAIERGKREVSLGTLRALALGLGIRPGVLVDGVPPGATGGGLAPLSRQALERVADAVVRGTAIRDAREQALADALSEIVRSRRRALSGRRGHLRRGKRAAESAWLWLEATLPLGAVQSLLQRIADRQGVHERTADPAVLPHPGA